MGFGFIDDTNSPDALCDGLAPLDSTVDSNRQRVSTLEAYLPLETALARAATLTICTGVAVCKIEFADDGVGHRARRVTFQNAKGGSQDVFSVKVRKEVVLTIPVAWEVPVTASLTYLATSPLKGALEFLKYIFRRRGILSMPIQVLSLFVRNSSIDDETAALVTATDDHDKFRLPDLEIMPLATSAMDDLEEHKRHFSKIGVFSLLSTLLRPESRGTVRLASSNPFDRPKVDLNLLNEPMDLKMARKAVRLALNLGNAMKTQGSPLLRGVSVPGQDGSREDIDEFIRHRARTTYHYSSTCRMASESDPQAPGVVDESLRVHGLSNVRVCDASIFPQILACHLMAPVVMAAEKCASMIKGDPAEELME
ncbi:MAG: hypothetical protein Q9211_001047 [Gyalolechia sp. 1 TL-2023]